MPNPRLAKKGYALGCAGSFGILVFSLLILSAFHLNAAPIVLPAETFGARDVLDGFNASIAAKNYREAATKIDALLGDEADQLMALRDREGNKDGGLISVAAWIQTLSRSDQALIPTAYWRKVDDAVRRHLAA